LDFACKTAGWGGEETELPVVSSNLGGLASLPIRPASLRAVRRSGLAREPVAGASLAERAAVAALKAAEAREEGGLAAAIAVRF
jgi:hypothetical protein